MSSKPKTLFEKVWERHVVHSIENGPDILYIDKHFIHEVTSPVAFEGINRRSIPIRRPDRMVATPDHNVPTLNQELPIKEELSRAQVKKLVENCNKHGITLYGLNHPFHGVVHIIGPELGITQPGMTIVCGDSHTATHGAFGSIAFGIGTSEIEMVMASQCIIQAKPKTMLITINGKLGKAVTSKDIILYIISKLSSGGGTGYFVEFSGDAIRNLSMEARMTICNMAIEMGARGGIIAPDEITYGYMKDREYAPKGKDWDKAVAYWKTLPSDKGAKFDKKYTFDASDIEPMITYGTNPGMGIKINGNIPANEPNQKALEYMGLNTGQKLLGKQVNYVFIGSCTNGRIEDFRDFANVIKGKKKAENIICWIVPGSKQVEKQIINEGLKEIFELAGFELRQPGCSACLAMNEDKIPKGEYCVATTNRNFEGRQGPGSRTFLASALTAAAVAITGKITDVRDLL